MSFLQALGAAGQGLSAGIQDLERMDDARFRKTQQKREKAKMDREDGFEADIAGLDPTAPDYNANMAAAAQKRGLHKDAATYRAAGDAATDRTRRLSREDISDRKEKLNEGVMNAHRMFGLGNNAGAVQALRAAYDQYPDGHKLVVNEDGTFGVAGPDAKWAVPPVEMTRENVGRALETAMKFGAPQMWSMFNKDARDDRVVGQGDRALEQGDRKLVQGDRTIDQNGAKITQDGKYQDSMLGIYRGRNALDQQEFDAKSKGGMFSRPPEAFTPLGLSDDGSRLLGRVGNGIKEIPVPPGYGALFPKVTGARTAARDEVQKAWLGVEGKLIENGEKPDAIRTQQVQFYARRGVAPEQSESALMGGIDPRTNKPLTEADVDAFNKRYPKSAVDKKDLPWLKAAGGR